MSIEKIKALRDKTGAGMMICKKALELSHWDEANAIIWLRQKGITLADEKQGRSTSEGLIQSYIHIGGKIGVLVELNCETDFVARTEQFQQLAKDIAMQIAAYPKVKYVSLENIPESEILKEKAIESGKEDLTKKPEALRDKIVSGRVNKKIQEWCLLNQIWIKDNSYTIENLIKELSATVGENIKINRFVRFALGEQ